MYVKIHIGDNEMSGPNVTLATPIHPLLPEERNIRKREDGSFYNLEYAKPITIKDNCWLASNVVVCGGVTIGEGCVIGAGSVVTRDIRILQDKAKTSYTLRTRSLGLTMNNSLAEVRPELVPERSEKNLPLKPDEITFGSNKKVWWIRTKRFVAHASESAGKTQPRRG